MLADNLYLCAMENEMIRPDYVLFDRQMTVFCNAIEMLVTGWHEYSATELSMDLHSLCIKGARLCYMADQDAVWQREDLTQQRLATNRQWHDSLCRLLQDRLVPMIMEVMQNYHEGVPFAGVKLPRFKGEFADFLPYLQASLNEDGATEDSQSQQLVVDLGALLDVLKERRKKNPEGETSEERFWNLVQLYALTCYLYYHFHKLARLEQQILSIDEAERLLVRFIQEYANSEEGSHALKTFRARLLFENDGRMLSRDQLMAAGKRLVNDIPEGLQYCYMAHRNDTARMAAEIIAQHPVTEELERFIASIAKWQMLHEWIYQMDHPTAQPALESGIFNTVLHGRTVDLAKLKEAIGRMVERVEYKNQWFCVWCVLKHHNLLADLHFQAFADQMMRPDWFGRERVPSFKGENISDYSEYLGQNDFTLWSLKDFQDYRILHGKPEKKWSDKLFNTFHHLCYAMDECLNG